MDLNLIIYIVGVFYIGATIYVANQDQISGQQGSLLRWLLYGIVAMLTLTAFQVLVVAMTGPDMIPIPGPQPRSIGGGPGTLIFLLIMALSVISGAAVTTPSVRLLVRRVVGAGFDPDSSVHMTALVLALALFGNMAAQFALSGGLAGVAEMIETTGLSFGDLLFSGVLWVVLALLGVGFAIRRGWPQTIARLGLRVPTLIDVRVGISIALLMIVFQFAATTLWASLVPPEQFAEQIAATEQMSAAINSPLLVLAIAVFAALGEEILFRGALQPVFGLIPTSLLFAVIHLQYALTPATLVIIVVALALGWTRQRYSTTAAIIAHFLYNFIPLALAMSAGVNAT